MEFDEVVTNGFLSHETVDGAEVKDLFVGEWSMVRVYQREYQQGWTGDWRAELGLLGPQEDAR